MKEGKLSGRDETQQITDGFLHIIIPYGVTGEGETIYKSYKISTDNLLRKSEIERKNMCHYWCKFWYRKTGCHSNSCEGISRFNCLSKRAARQGCIRGDLRTK